MKRMFAWLLVICLMATTLCVTTLAAEAPAAGVVLRVSAMKADGSLEVIQDYTVFDDGWNAAMELATDKATLSQKQYARVVVDLYADWTAVKGAFTDDTDNGKGFNWDAICFQKDVKITLNMNGHTIDRDLKTWQYSGEVMCINENADVIINDGTITGGWSCNGAGGLYICDDAKVTLNNVNLVGNIAQDDDGAAVAIYDGATLVMNGGSVSHNIVKDALAWASCHGALYVNDANVTLNQVTLEGNEAKGEAISGVVAYTTGHGVVTFNECLVESNGIDADKMANSLFHGDGGEFVFEKTVFKNNGVPVDDSAQGKNALIRLGAKTTINECTFTGNQFAVLLLTQGSGLPACEVTNSVFTDNGSEINGAPKYLEFHKSAINFAGCKFNNNGTGPLSEYAIRGYQAVTITLTDCDLGDSTICNPKLITVQNLLRGNTMAASMFSNGSMAMIVAMTALIVAIFTHGFHIAANKKRANMKAKEE